jgi:phosphate transport system permease protein
MAAITVPPTAALGRRRLDKWGLAFQFALLFCLVACFAFLFALLADVFNDGAAVFSDRGTDFLTSNLSTRPAEAGVAQAIKGSLLLAAFVVVIAFPLGIATAVYLEEYAPDSRLTRFFAVNIRNLAGVPSVVYGLLGLTIFVALLRSLGFGNGRNLLAAILTLGVLVLPIVIITSAEALRAVPMAIREAGYGVGASRWEVTRKLVLPAAAPGILTGTVLALARALGETAPILLVGAVMGGFSSADGGSIVDFLSQSFTALPVTVFQWSKQPQEEFRQLAAAAIVILLAITLFANAVAILLRNRFERTW